MYFKGGVTIKSLLMTAKDQDPMLKRSGVIYKYTCDRVECDEEYIGESSRTTWYQIQSNSLNLMYHNVFTLQ